MREMARAILLLLTDLEIGGTPTVVRELAIRLNAPPDVRLDVACLAGRGPVADQLQAAGIGVFPLNARGSTDFSVFARLRRLIRDNAYDTVFSFLLHANAAAAAVKPFVPNVRFFQSIQTTQPHPRWHWFVQSLVHRAAERIVVPSRSVADAAMDWADVPQEKIVIIPNAVDVSGGTGAPPVFSDEHGRGARATKEPAHVGFIGRLDPIKRIPDLLRAVQLLGNRVHLDVFGEGADRPQIEQVIHDLQLNKTVALHGVISTPKDALSTMDLLVLPSAAEGFGLVLIEAMAVGIAVVATNVPGIRDVVRDGQTGLLVAPFSPAELARAIGRVLDDPVLRSRLIEQARGDVARRFTWDVVLPQYRSLLGLA